MDLGKLVTFGKQNKEKGRYEGQLIKTIPNGKGSLFFKDIPLKGWIYRGEWVDGLECGQGMMIDDKRTDR